MEPMSFDALVRSFVTSASRRGLLTIVAMGSLATLLAPLKADEAVARRRRRRNKNKRKGNGSVPSSPPTLPPPVSPPTPPDCPAGQRLCPEGICLPVDQCCLQEKACNGGCIPVEDCCGGCPTGQTCCPSPRIGICADLQNDPFNCGICQRICPTGNGCSAGNCVP